MKRVLKISFFVIFFHILVVFFIDFKKVKIPKRNFKKKIKVSTIEIKNLERRSLKKQNLQKIKILENNKKGNEKKKVFKKKNSKNLIKKKQTTKKNKNPFFKKELLESLNKSIKDLSFDKINFKEEKIKIPILQIVGKESSFFKENKKLLKEKFLKELEKNLHLPEFGSVKAKLIFLPDGKIESIEILSSKSKKNEKYLREWLENNSFYWIKTFSLKKRLKLIISFFNEV